jgi:glycosyltransferase involved in cell wall biosynthesis
MKILTTNSAGSDVFGGIHTRKTEQIRHSPRHTFHVVELNREKKYLSHGNLNVHKVNTIALTGGKTIFELLSGAKNHREFDVSVERIVNEFQNSIRDVEPDIVLIPGTSLTSYFLFKACRRGGILDRTVQEYAGVLEKEIVNYSGDTRFILGKIGKVFVSEEAREDMTYLFPSQLCKDEVEGIHRVTLDRSHIVWNGVSEEFFFGESKRNPPQDLTLGYVGRMQHVKNLPFFLSLNENMNRKAILKIITDLSAAAKKNTGTVLLERMTAGDVFYYAPRAREELKLFYETQLSAAVVPSFFETYCNGAVESLVCGTPTLLSDRAGASEVYKKYDLTGLLFTIDSMSSFEASLNYAEGMGFMIKRDLSREIYEDLKWEKAIAKYNQIFEEVASRNAA